MQCRAHLALKPDGGAAFSIELENEERLVVVQEIDTRWKHEAPEIIETVREAISEEFEIQPAAVVLISRHASENIQRESSTWPSRIFKNSLSVIAEWRAMDERKNIAPAAPDELNAETVELWLQKLLTARLNVDGPLIDARQSIARYGIDSLLALELTHAVENSFRVRLSSTSFLRNPTIKDLTSEILEQLARPHARQHILQVWIMRRTSFVAWTTGALGYSTRLTESTAYNVSRRSNPWGSI